MYYLYLHISPNNKKYIGITKQNPKYRWGKNGEGYRDNNYFWKAIQKYGWDNFTHIIIADNLIKEEACQWEIDYIAYYKTNDNRFGYNLSSGGELSAIGCSRTDEQRLNYSKAFKSKPRSEKQKKALQQLHAKNKGKVAWNKGIKTGPRNLPEDTKKRMYEKISKALTGRKLSAEHIEKSREGHLGQIAWNKGKKMTPEQRLAYKKYWDSMKNKPSNRKGN